MADAPKETVQTTEPSSLGRRPNTVLPSPSTFMAVNSSQLMAMKDSELIDFASRFLGITAPKGTSRNTLMTRIVNSAISTRAE